MAGIAAQQPSVSDFMASTDGMGSEMYSHRTNVRAPEPNPNFSFPRPTGTSEASTSSNTSRKRIRPTDLSLLPHKPTDFEQPSVSPQQMPGSFSNSSSPGKARPMSSRGGHRRGGSEFIGGDGNSNGPGLMSTSPTKGVTSVPAPAVAAAAAGASAGASLSSPSAAGRRRGHAHRRSGAMSTNDFSAMLNQSLSTAPPLPGSAPVSPSNNMLFIQPMPVLERHHSHPTMTTQEKIDEANAAGEKEEKELASTPTAGESRPRVVGFSDKVVIIPRPLSTISSADTESTISTIRPAHSVNDSISSILDQRPPTPISAGLPADSSDESRPATSDDLMQTEFFGPAEDINNSPPRPQSGSGNSLLRKRRSPPPPSLDDDEEVSPGTVIDPNFYSSMATAMDHSPSLPSPLGSPDEDLRSVGVRLDKKKSRVRSILLRRNRKHLKEEAAEHPSTTATASDDPNVPEGLLSLDEVNFDEDTTCVIHAPDYEEPEPTPVFVPPSPLPSSLEREGGDVLDLDATYNAVQIDEDSPNSFTNFMRGAMPLRQHRRTESAPSLSPMQRTAFAPGKASPKMADVFEEDEEEESPQRAQRPKARSFHQPQTRNLKGLGVQIVDAEAADATQPRRKSRSPSSKMSPRHEKAADLMGHVEEQIGIARTTDEPRFSTVTKSSDDGTITPSGLDESPHLQPNPALDAPLLDPISTVPTALDFASPPFVESHAHHGSSDFSTSSAAPSPNPTTISFDAPRLNTAASSITDRTNWSAAHSQRNNSSNALPCRGDESAASEDVPSLASSTSTALSGYPSHPSTSANASASPSPVVPRGPAQHPFGSGKGYHAHTFSGLSRPRTTGFAGGEGINRPSSVGAERAFSLAGLGGLSQRSSMPRPWSSRPSTANNSKRSSLASLSKLMSKGESERSKLSISWGAHDDREGGEGMVMGAKEGKDKGGKRRLSRMLKFWKGKDKDRPESKLMQEMPELSDSMMEQ